MCVCVRADGCRQVDDDVPESDDETNNKGDEDAISGDKLISASKPGKRAKTTTTRTSAMMPSGKQPRGKVKPKR